MQELARSRTNYDIDYWLNDVVAGVLDSNDAIKVDRAELWTLLDSLPVAILISTDRSCTRIVGNIAAQALLNVPLGANISQGAAQADLPGFKVLADGLPMHPKDLPMQRAAQTGRRVPRSECEIRFDDGRSIFIAGHCIPIKDDSGEICGSLGAFIDITEQKRGLESAELMAREMVHRNRNTVSLIQAMAVSTIRATLGANEFATFDSRLANIARAQDLLKVHKEASVGLVDLLEKSVHPVVSHSADQVTFAGPEAAVEQDDAIALSLVFHELATNACKYGALTASGRVEVSWMFEPLGQGTVISLTWKESGGPPCATPVKPGFGSKLIQRVVKSLPYGSAKADYGADGLTMWIRFGRRNAAQAASAPEGVAN